MQIERRAVLPLRIFLVVLFGVLVVLQTFSLPGQFRHEAQVHPENAEWRWPLTVLAVLCVLAAQVIVVATWKLLGLFKDDVLPESFANPAAKEVLRYRQALRVGFDQVSSTGLLTTNHIVQIQGELERNNAGLRRLNPPHHEIPRSLPPAVRGGPRAVDRQRSG